MQDGLNQIDNNELESIVAVYLLDQDVIAKRLAKEIIHEGEKNSGSADREVAWGVREVAWGVREVPSYFGTP